MRVNLFFPDINECNNGLCVNAINCIDTLGSFTCICQDGWTGELCTQGRCPIKVWT